MNDQNNTIVIIPADGFVLAFKGTVVRINEDGSREILAAGSRVHSGDQIVVGDAGGALIELTNGQQLMYAIDPDEIESLGQNESQSSFASQTAAFVVDASSSDDSSSPSSKESQPEESATAKEADEHHGFLAATHLERDNEQVHIGIGHKMSGKLVFDDEDQLYHLPEHGIVLPGNLGTLNLSPDGNWTYQLYSPPAGGSAPEAGQDGQSIDSFAIPGAGQHISIGVQTFPDKPAIISGVSTGSVTEDVTDSSGNLLTGGTLTVQDNDSRQAHFTAESLVGKYGVLTIDQQGHWNYQARNSNPRIQELNAGQSVTDVITVKSADGTTHDVTVTVHGTNDNPVINAITAQSATEDGASVTGTITSTDVDAGDNATYKTTNAPAGFTLNGDGTYTFDPTDAAYQGLAKGQTQTLTIPVKATDTHSGVSAAQNLVITVTGTNDVPTVSAPVVLPAGFEDKGQTITTAQLLANAHDMDTTDTLDVSGLKADHGTISGPDSSGNYHFTPDANYNGPVTFSYDVTDGQGGTAHTSATTTLAAVQDAATITGMGGDVTEDGTQTFSTKLGITDPDAGEDHFNAGTVKGTYGSAAIDAAGHLVYTLDNSAANVQALAAGQTVHDVITVTSADGTTHDVTMTVHGTNDNPVVSAITAQSATEDGSAVSGTIISTDVDTGDTASYTTSNPPAGFTLKGDDTYTFDPTDTAYQHLAKGEHQTLTIPVTATDSQGATDAKDLVITITGTNDVPTVSAPVTLPAGTEDASQTFTAADLLANSHDIDSTDVLSISGTVTADHGTVSGPDASGNYHFAPDPNYNGAVNFSYSVTDSQGGTVATSATTTLSAVADAAVITGSGGDVTEDGTQTLSTTLGITDPDAGQDHFQAQTITGTYGSAVIDQAGHLVYTLDNNAASVQALAANQTVHDVITVTSADGTTHDVTMTVHGTNDNPVVSAITAQAATEDGASVSGTITSTDVDTGDTASYTTSNPPAGFTLKGDGSYTFDPTDAAYQHLAKGEPQTLTIPVTATDSQGATDVKDLVITITGTNDVPTVSAPVTLPAGTEDTSQTISASQLLANSADIDSTDVLSISGTVTADHGTVSGPDSSGNYTFTPDPNYNGAVNFSYSVTDSQGGTVATTATTTLSAVNDAATITATGGTVTEDGSTTAGQPGASVYTEQLGITDKDAGEDHFNAGTIKGSYGSATVDAQGHFTYTLDNSNPAVQALSDYASTTLTDHITVTSADGTTHTIDMAIDGADDKAVISGANTGTVKEDSSVDAQGMITTAGKLTVVDPDAGEAVFTPKTTTTSHGEFTIDAQGNWTYKADTTDARIQALGANDHIDDSFWAVTADGTHQRVTVTINGTNDGPTATFQSMTGTEDTDVTLATTNFGFTDVDTTDTLDHVTITTLPDPTHGKLTLNGVDVTAGQDIDAADIGNLKLEPAKDYNGDVNYGYTVNDGHADSAPATGTINLVPVADAMVDSGPRDLGTTDEDTATHFTEAQLLAHLSDPDGALHVVSGSITSAHGTITGDAAHGYTFTPAANYKGQDLALNYKVSDGTTETAKSATIDVHTVTDAATVGMTMTAEQDVIVTGSTGTGRIQINNINAPHAMTEFTMEFTVLGQHVANSGATGPVIVNMGNSGDNNMLSLWNPASMKIGGAGNFDTGIDLGDGHSHRITLTWDSASGTMKVYDNGQHIVDVPNYHKGGSIPADVFAVLGGKMNDPGTHGGFNAGEHYDGKIFNAAMATHALSATDIAKAPMASQLDKNSGLLIDIRSVGGQFIDSTGHISHVDDHGLTHSTSQVDISLAPPPPGSTLHLHPIATAPADSDDHITKLELTGLLKGTLLDDGHGHTHTITGLADKVDVSGWNQTDISAQLPAGVNQNMNIGVIATTTGPDGTETTASHYQGLALDPAVAIPEIIDGDDDKTTDEDSAITGDLDIHGTAAGHDHFQAQTVATTHGSLAIKADGTWTFTPNAAANAMADGAKAQDVITVHSQDGTAHDITVHLTGTNDAPTVTTSTVSVSNAHTFTAAEFGFGDADTGDTLDHITVNTLPTASRGVLTLNGVAVTAGQDISNADIAHLQFAGTKGYNGQAGFNYTVNDGHTDSAPATATLDVSYINHAPTITPASISGTEDTDFTLSTANFGFADVDAGDTLDHVTIGTLPATTEGQLLLNGQAVSAGEDISKADLDAGHLVFHPATNYNGQVHFDYTVNDGTVDSSSAQATVHIAAVDDAMVDSGPRDLGTTDEDTAKHFTESQLLAHLSDPDGALHVVAGTITSAHGTITGDTAHGYTFTPAANYKGQDLDLNYKVSDGTTETAKSATIDVHTVTDAATVVNDMHVERTAFGMQSAGDGYIKVAGDHLAHTGDLHAFTQEITYVQDPNIHIPDWQVFFRYDPPPGHGKGIQLYTWGNLMLNVGGNDLDTGINMNDGKDHRITVTWDAKDNVAHLFDNGVEKCHIDSALTGSVLAGGGSFNAASKYVPAGFGGYGANTGTDKFTGKMLAVGMADHALTAAQVKNAPLHDHVDKNSGMLIDIRSTPGTGAIEDQTGLNTIVTQNMHTVPNQVVDVKSTTLLGSDRVHIDLQAAATDPDDTVTKLEIKGFVTGTVLWDGHGHSHSFMGPNDAVDVHGWNLTDLSAQLPSSVSQNMNIATIATTTGPDGTTTTSTDFDALIVNPNVGVPEVIDGDDDQTTDEDSAITGDLDIHGGTAGHDHFQAQTLTTTHGSLAIKADGTWTFTPNAAANAMADGDKAQDVVTVQSQDGTAHDITVHLTGTNDVPTVTTSAITAQGAHNFTAAEFGFTDVDTGDTLDHITIKTLPTASQGVLTLNGVAVTAGQDISNADIAHLQFSGAQGYNGQANFDYTVNDGHADSATATATMDVPLNYAPTVAHTMDFGSVDEATGTGAAPTATFSESSIISNLGATDVDGDTVSVTGIDAVDSSGNSVGSFVKSGGSWVFTASGTDISVDDAQLTVHLSDGHGKTAIGHGTLDIAPKVDATAITLNFGSHSTVTGGTSSAAAAAAATPTSHFANNSSSLLDMHAVTADVSNNQYNFIFVATNSGTPDGTFDWAQVQSITIGGQTIGQFAPPDVLQSMSAGTPVGNNFGNYIDFGPNSMAVMQGLDLNKLVHDLNNGAEIHIAWNNPAAHPHNDFKVIGSKDPLSTSSTQWKEIVFGKSPNVPMWSADGGSQALTHVPVATPTHLFDEDTTVPLNFHITGTDHDGSEVIGSVHIAGIPQGAKLLDGSGHEIQPASGGGYDVPASAIGHLSMVPPPDYSGKFTLTVTADVTDTAGALTDTKTLTFSENVEINPVSEHIDVGTMQDINITEDAHPAAGGASTIDLNIPITTHADADGSETETVTIVGVPNGVTLSAGTEDPNHPGTWNLTPSDLSNLKLNLPPNFAGQINLAVTATNTDGTAQAATDTEALHILVSPSQDSTFTATNSALSGNVGDHIALGALTFDQHGDTSEHLGDITIQVPSGWTVIDSQNPSYVPTTNNAAPSGYVGFDVDSTHMSHLELVPPSSGAQAGNLDVKIFANITQQGTNWVPTLTLPITLNAAPGTQPAPDAIIDADNQDQIDHDYLTGQIHQADEQLADLKEDLQQAHDQGDDTKDVQAQIDQLTQDRADMQDRADDLASKHPEWQSAAGHDTSDPAATVDSDAHSDGAGTVDHPADSQIGSNDPDQEAHPGGADLSGLVAHDAPLNFDNLNHDDVSGHDAGTDSPSPAAIAIADVLDQPTTETATVDVNDLLAQQPKTAPVAVPEDHTVPHDAGDTGHDAAPDSSTLDSELIDTDDPDPI